MHSTTRLTSLIPYAIVTAISLPLAYLLRFDLAIPFSPVFVLSLFVFPAAKLLAFYLGDIHDTCRVTVGITECTPLVLGNVAGSVVATLLLVVASGNQFPRSVAVIDFLLSLLLTGTVHLWSRLMNEVLQGPDASQKDVQPVLIYGAGVAGTTLARELRVNARLGCKVVGFVDDSPQTQGQVIAGVRVLGSGTSLPILTQNIFQRAGQRPSIFIALPAATQAQIAQAVEHCRVAEVNSKIIPSLGELIHGKRLSEQTRELQVEDLLGRAAVSLDETAIRERLTDTVVMVTGGAGSIGSELCRQIAGYQPRKLIIFDQSESALFMLHRTLLGRFPEIEICPELGDICSRPRLLEVMLKHRVKSVFHAAAYKHVPMMEVNIGEAVQNNVLGTYNVLRSAEQCSIDQLLMISSDKAVNPTNIMGLTKRVAELLMSSTSSAEGSSPLRCVSVRFGNVLGSNGSVIPIFREQIAAGGPVTITHPEMRRYFMTVAEAVQLVLQASSMGKGSEIFVLDMGEPVRILDLAQRMIQLAGFVPYGEIPIEFTGLRPGEKLFEELTKEGEDILPTFHEKIKIFSSSVPSRHLLDQWMKELTVMVEERDELRMIRHLSSIVPEYTPVDRWKELLAEEYVPQIQAAAIA